MLPRNHLIETGQNCDCHHFTGRQIIRGTDSKLGANPAVFCLTMLDRVLFCSLRIAFSRDFGFQSYTRWD